MRRYLYESNPFSHYPQICDPPTLCELEPSLKLRPTSRRTGPPSALCAQHAFRLGGVRRDGIHQRRRQAIIGLQFELLETRADRTHLIGPRTGFDDRGDECRELRRRPASVVGELRVDEIEAVEGMRLVLDPAVHVHAAVLAGVALDRT